MNLLNLARQGLDQILGRNIQDDGPAQRITLGGHFGGMPQPRIHPGQGRTRHRSAAAKRRNARNKAARKARNRRARS